MASLDSWLSELRQSPVLFSVAVSIFAVVGYYVHAYWASPLHQYPGPFLAKFTNFWRLYRISRGNFHKELQALHAKYGPVVRIGPNVLDIDYPDLNKTVFNTKGDWRKTEAYLGSNVVVDGHIVYNVFSELDKTKHANEKRPIAKYYSATGVATIEPHVDKVISQFCDEIETRFVDNTKPVSAAKPFNFGTWTNFYTWDVIGALTFSQPLGYLSKGIDFDGTIKIAEKAIEYFGLLTAMPSLDYWFDKNPIYRLGPPGFANVGGISVQHMVDRYQGADSAYHDAAQPDYLDRFIEAKTDNPSSVDDAQVVSWLMINMVAGADTTATIIRNAVYYSLKTPRVWARLRSDLASAGLTAEHTPLPLKAVRALPYLEAIVNESLRILPAVILSMERYVPAGGQRLLDGSVVPENTILGFNLFVLGRNKKTWGDDAEEFRPERWLQNDGEADEGYRARLQEMHSAAMSFGGGSRICLGKHMGLMQVYKVIATLAVRYEVQLAHPEREWRVVNHFFPMQEGLEVKIARRV
ncbi:cytochrome P450 [Podospora appendiculata]|uniref:Cytochrome P450 n=1 Tax=Podospora appendiculata TaxID=314037 RepID=A0AAE0X056_9PEZI|nr:cytochrome P450 [Podospora appendiculata]